MSTPRQALIGLLAVVISGVVIIGSLILVMNESGLGNVFDPSIGETQMAVDFASPEAGSPVFITSAPGKWTATPTVTSTGTSTPTATMTPTPSITSTATQCPLPEGWQVIILTESDSLDMLAEEFEKSVEELLTANCLSKPEITSGMSFYIPIIEPVAPGKKPTRVTCGPPAGWVVYIVQYGDTLFSLSQAMGVTVYQLQNANCMGSSTLIRTGQKLWVPYVPTSTPTSVPNYTSTSTILPSLTSTSAPADPTSTETPVPSETPLPLPTDPPPPTSTNTPLPTNTPVPTETPVPN